MFLYKQRSYLSKHDWSCILLLSDTFHIGGSREFSLTGFSGFQATIFIFVVEKSLKFKVCKKKKSKIDLYLLSIEPRQVSRNLRNHAPKHMKVTITSSLPQEYKLYELKQTAQCGPHPPPPPPPPPSPFVVHKVFQIFLHSP